MPGKVEALAILFVLLPGFLCAYIAQSLAARRQQSDIEKVIEALIFSFVLYLITLPRFGFTLPVHWQSAQDGSLRIGVAYPYLLTLFVLSVALGILYAANINHDWLMGLMRTLRVTERTARISIWNDSFQEIKGWVQIGFQDGSQIRGWVRYYSEDASDSSIFLERAAWVDGDTVNEIDGPGILLTAAATIETITFLGTRSEVIDENSSLPTDEATSSI